MRLHGQRALQTHRHAMLALEVPQISWRTTVAHLPTEDMQRVWAGAGLMCDGLAPLDVRRTLGFF